MNFTKNEKVLCVVIIVIIIIVYLLHTQCKKENMTYSYCPYGFEVSLNQHACVKPGEKKKPCKSGQIHADNVCRYPIREHEVPKGWHLNYTGTGIWSDF